MDRWQPSDPAGCAAVWITSFTVSPSRAKSPSIEATSRMSSDACEYAFGKRAWSAARAHCVDPSGPTKCSRNPLSMPTTSKSRSTKYVVASRPIKPAEPWSTTTPSSLSPRGALLVLREGGNVRRGRPRCSATRPPSLVGLKTLRPSTRTSPFITSSAQRTKSSVRYWFHSVARTSASAPSIAW